MKMSSAKADVSVSDGSLTNRNKVRIAFMEREKKEVQSYISDLEVTVAINKSIIQDLCTSGPKEVAGQKAALHKLNDENIALQKQLKEFKKQRDEALARVLILEQMLEELRAKEAEQINELKEKNTELLEQLNLKEYHIQVYEKRCNDAEALVIRYLKNVPEAMEAIGEVHAPINEGMGISNVVIQNSKMKAKVAELTSEMTRLKRELSNSETRKLIEVLKIKINGLVEENEGQRQKLGTQTKMNQELYELNEKLSAQLSNLNKQLSVLMHSQKMVHAETMHTHSAHDPPAEMFYTQDVRGRKQNESFGEMSSISIDAAGDEAEGNEEDGDINAQIDVNQFGGDEKQNS